MKQTEAAQVSERAKKYNFDELLRLFIVEDEPKEFKNHLQSLYYGVVEHIGRTDSFCAYVDDLYHLQLIIEALDNVNDLTTKQIEINVK